MTERGRRLRIALVWTLRALCVLALVVGIDHAVTVVSSGGAGFRLDTLVYAALSGFVMAFGAFALSETLAIDGGLKSAVAIRLEAVWLARGVAAILAVLAAIDLAAMAPSLLSNFSTTWRDFGPGAALRDLIVSLYPALSGPLLLLGFSEVLRAARPRIAADKA